MQHIYLIGSIITCDLFIVAVPEIRRGLEELNCIPVKTMNKKKKNFCIFCKKLFTQLPRHLESKHIMEPEVKKIMSFSKSKTFILYLETDLI